ncbi:hypothetical protein Tco_1451266, partial [Tanacetum coccineum]
MEQMTSMCDMVGQLIQKKEEEKRIEEEQAAKDRYWKIPVCYDDEESSIPLKDIISELPPVEDLVQILSESEDSFKGECDLPPYDDSSKNHDLTFSNPLFDINEDFTSSDESFFEEDVPNENFKIFSNPLFDPDEEITSTKVDQIDDDIDSLLDEFAGELTLLKSIPPGIDDVNLDPKGDILLLESFLYDKSSPRPPEEFNYENPTESFSPSPIPIE